MSLIGVYFIQQEALESLKAGRAGIQIHIQLQKNNPPSELEGWLKK
jgi:hypothetical protein